MPHEPHPVERRGMRLLQRRVERKGLRPRLAASVIALCWLAAVVASGVLMRFVDPDTFDTVWLGMWWAIQTVTTVGYGDVVPEQTEGKIVASVLMIGGLSLLAVVTATITSAFVARAEAERRATGHDPVTEKLEEISARIEELSARLDGDGRP